MLPNQIGEQGFHWWIGTVEKIDSDPKKLGRIKIRIMNLHDDSLDVDDLPWAMPSLPVTSSSLMGVGISPTGIEKGSRAWGFFLDGATKQIPVYTGCIPFIKENKDENHGVAQLAREINSIQKTPLGPEPESSYASKYPYNKVITTKSGHAIELDDTDGAERIHIYHKAGSYMEINQDGRFVYKSANDSYHIVAGDETVYIDGDVNTHVTGNVKILVDGDANIEVNGDLISKAKKWTHTGDVKIDGDVEVTKDVTASGISLVHHKTSGVDSGSGTSGEPI